MKISLLLFVAAILLGGCASTRPYDPVVTVAVREMVFRTKAVVERGDAGRLSLVESRRCLSRGQAQARSLRAGAADHHLSAQEVAILDSLDEQYGRLLRDSRPVRNPAASRLMAALYALQDLRPLPEATTTESDIPDSIITTDDPSTSDTSSTDSKRCGKDHDHRDRDCDCKKDHH